MKTSYVVSKGIEEIWRGDMLAIATRIRLLICRTSLMARCLSDLKRRNKGTAVGLSDSTHLAVDKLRHPKKHL